MKQTKEKLRQVFENGDKPNQQDFYDWQDSYWHKDENIPKEKIIGLSENAGLHKKYIAFFNQYNTNYPSVEIIENNLGTINWVRISEGVQILYSNGLFTNNTSIFCNQIARDHLNEYKFIFTKIDSFRIILNVYFNGILRDYNNLVELIEKNLDRRLAIEIKVYNQSSGSGTVGSGNSSSGMSSGSGNSSGGSNLSIGGSTIENYSGGYSSDSGNTSIGETNL